MKTFLFCLMLIPMMVFAQEVPASEAPDPIALFIQHALVVLQAIPGVGKYASMAFEVIAALGAVFTFLSVAVVGILKVPYIVAKISGAEDLASKIQKFIDKVSPYLKYFSIFNVQKPKK